MFTTGYEITTAATNVFNAIVTAILAWKVFRDIRPDYRKQLWLTVFFLFFLICIFGAVIHGFVMTSEMKSTLWNYLFGLLSFMVASFVIAIIYETDGPTNLLRKSIVVLILAISYLAIQLLIPTVRRMGFTAFSICATLFFVYAIIKIIAVRKEKPYTKNFLYGIICLVIGSAAQMMKFIKFHFIYDFNYNSVYHLLTLFLVLFVYKGLKEAQQYPEP